MINSDLYTTLQIEKSCHTPSDSNRIKAYVLVFGFIMIWRQSDIFITGGTEGPQNKAQAQCQTSAIWFTRNSSARNKAFPVSIFRRWAHILVHLSTFQCACLVCLLSSYLHLKGSEYWSNCCKAHHGRWIRLMYRMVIGPRTNFLLSMSRSSRTLHSHISWFKLGPCNQEKLYTHSTYIATCNSIVKIDSHGVLHILP